MLAEFGRYPLQIRFWQQILRYHNRAVRLPDSRLVKLALVDGAQLQDGNVIDQQKQGWRASVSAFLSEQPSHPRVFQYLDVSAIMDGLREAHQSTFYTRDDLSSLVLYRSLQPDYCYANYLSSVNCFYNKKLISRFRCGCHGLHVDTGRFGQGAQKLDREDRVCEVCHSTAVEDEQHFLFDCPAYAHTRDAFPALFQNSYPSVGLFINTDMLGRYLRQCFLTRGQTLGLA